MVGGIDNRLAEARKVVCPKFEKSKKTDRCKLEEHPGKLNFVQNEHSVVGSGKIARSIDFSEGYMRNME